MGSYFKTVASATMSAVSAVAEAAMVIGPATVDATKRTVSDINFWADSLNDRMTKAGIPIQSSADVPLDVEAAPALEAASKAAEPLSVSAMLSVEAYAYPMAMMALLNYVSRCDQNLAKEEEALMQAALDNFCAIPNTPDEVKGVLKTIFAKEDLKFEDVALLFDAVRIEDLDDMSRTFEAAARADGVIVAEEEKVRDVLDAYLTKRLNG